MNDDQKNLALGTRVARMTIQAGAALLLACGSSAYGASSLEDMVVAGPCVNCHGPDGRSPGAIPSIAGLPESELKSKLLAFKSDAPPAGTTAGTTIMNRLAKGYTEDQINVLARYYARMLPATGAATGAKP